MLPTRLATRGLAVLALVIAAAVLVFECGDYFLRNVRDVETAGRKPTVIREFGDGLPVAQSFTTQRDGLHSVTVSIASDQPAVISFEFSLIRRGIIADWPDEPITRRAVQMSVPPGVTRETIDFPPVSRSRRRTFVATYRLLDVMRPGSSTSGPRVALSAWADEAYPGGALTVGANQRWGDLAFSAQVDPPTRAARLKGTLDAMLPGWLPLGKIGLAVLASLYGLLLATVCMAAVRAVPITDVLTERGAMPQDEPIGPGAMRSLRTAGGVALGVAAPILLAAILMTRERVAVDLLDQLDAARMESPSGMHAAFSQIEEVINGLSPPALFAHPPSHVTWHVQVPSQRPLFKTYIALRTWVWEGKSDGAGFEVSVTDGTQVTTVSRFLNPRYRFNDRAWVELDLDLAPYAGRAVDISLSTSPGPKGDVAWDWALWGMPRIISRQWPHRG